MRLWLLISVVLFSFFVRADASPATCTTSNAVSIPIGPDRDQKNSNYCYGFAATAVLQERYCRGRHPACQFTDTQNDQLSAADVIVTGNSGKVIAGGDAFTVLQAVETRGKIAKESCARIDEILSHSKIVVQRTNTPEWLDLIRTSWQEVQTKNKMTCTEQAALKLRGQLDIDGDITQTMRALQNPDFAQAMAQIMIPDECAGQAVAMPPAIPRKWVGGELSRTFQTLNDLIIKEKKPVVMNLCARTPEQTALDWKAKSDDPCSMHSLVIRGSRQLCCGVVCKTQYQIFDSAHIFVGHGLEADNWLDQSKLEERLTAKRRMDQTPSMGHSDGLDLIWLD